MVLPQVRAVDNDERENPVTMAQMDSQANARFNKIRVIQ